MSLSVCPCSTLGQAVPSPIHQPTAHGVLLTEPEPAAGTARDDGGSAKPSPAQTELLPWSEPAQPRPGDQKLKGTMEGQAHMLTWTGPMLLFLPPGMPSSLIAERHNQT